MNSSSPTQKLLKDIGFTLLSEGKTIKIRAEGYSMYPSVKPGSVIFIEPLNSGEIPSPGEIVAWKRDANLVVHRLIRTFREGNKTILITRGDCKNTEDPFIYPEDIAGRVIRIEDRNGIPVPAFSYSERRHSYLFNRISCFAGRVRKKIGKSI